MQLTYLGHACFLLETSKAKILFDPFINPNSIVQEIRSASLDTSLVSKLNTDDIKCDYVLVSHGHEDHIVDAEAILKSTNATVVSNFEIVSWFGSKGINNGHPMNHGGSWTFDFGKVKYVTAVHSSVLPDGTYGGNPGGFVIEADGKTIYYAGDTALTYDMKLIAESYTVDLAILPIGDNFTMGPEDASRAAKFVECDNVIGMHFDTFGYIKVNHEDVKTLFAQNGQHIELMTIGQTKEL
jgi:L-ascorbate metabolism protein UlaG (beta-lactamase superfamily)